MTEQKKVMKQLAFILLFLCSLILPVYSQQTSCKVTAPYFGMFDLAMPPPQLAFDAIIFYNGSTCPFSLPPYDIGIQFGSDNQLHFLYFNGFVIPETIIGVNQNILTFEFTRVAPSILNPACTLKTIERKGSLVFLSSHYWVNGNMDVTVSHPMDVSVCGGIF